MPSSHFSRNQPGMSTISDWPLQARVTGLTLRRMRPPVAGRMGCSWFLSLTDSECGVVYSLSGGLPHLKDLLDEHTANEVDGNDRP